MSGRYRPWQVAMVIMSTTCALLPCRSGLTDQHATTSVKSTDTRPNIVLIMADDMGYSDIGCYGGEINTPNLNRLAGNGLRFTQFYNTGRCCPTRASLLTGLYPHQAGVGWMMSDRGYKGYRGDLNRECVTIAEALRPAGYSTYMAGKWHIARDVQPKGPKHNWPIQRGFDRFYGTITGAGSFFDPATLTRDNTPVSPLADPKYKPKTYYYTNAISDHAIQFIEDHNKKQQDKPFFLYVAYTAAHWPMHALPEDVAKYRGKYDKGYKAIRKKRLTRMRKMGLLSPQWKMSKQAGDWNNVKNVAWELRCMEVYAAMVDNMDQGIGRIIQSLRSTAELDNTLILFLQDNGGCQETVGRRGNYKRPVKASLPKIANDALLTAVIPRQNRAGVPTLKGPGIMPGPADTYIAYGLNWANVSNTPFREYKHYVHEGGVSTPLIAHWPKGIAKSRHGKLVHQPGHLIDVMATCVDLAKAKYPKTLKGKTIQAMEGVSLVPALSSQNLARKGPIFWEHEGNRAIRDGKWKLVAKENRAWELFDMSQDRTEMNDLATKIPNVAKRLEVRWNTWAKRARVLPLGAWRGKPQKVNRQQLKFSLGPMSDLARSKAPYLPGRSIDVRIELTEPGQGVLVAHGGTAEGFAVFVANAKKLTLCLRRQGKIQSLTVISKRPLAGQVRATLAKNGEASLFLDDRLLGKKRFSKGLVRMPADGLQVGRDRGGNVGPYKSPNRFSGKIKRVLISLKP